MHRLTLANLVLIQGGSGTPLERFDQKQWTTVCDAPCGLDLPVARHTDFANKDMTGAAVIWLGADGATGELAPICAQGWDSSMRPETNFPLRQWPLSTPPPLRT
jgi:hypothetical protein